MPSEQSLLGEGYNEKLIVSKSKQMFYSEERNLWIRTVKLRKKGNENAPLHLSWNSIQQISIALSQIR